MGSCVVWCGALEPDLDLEPFDLPPPPPLLFLPSQSQTPLQHSAQSTSQHGQSARPQHLSRPRYQLG